MLIKEKELALSQLTIVEKETSKLVADLREHIGQLQTRLNASQKDEESQLKKLHSALKENQQVAILNHSFIFDDSLVFYIQKTEVSTIR